jgi:hypothetical protein
MSKEFPGPSWRDWLLLLGSLGFVALGILLWRHDRNTAVTSIAFFGACAAVGTAQIVSKLRMRNVVMSAIPEGVPLRPRPGTIIAMGLGLLALGATLYIFQAEQNSILRWISLGIAGFGTLLLMGWLTGYLPAGFVQLDPDALVVATSRSSMHIPWDAIGGVEIRTFHGHVTLCLDPLDLDRIESRPPLSREKLNRSMALAKRLGGAPVMILQTQVDVPLPSLYKAIRSRVPHANSGNGDKRFDELIAKGAASDVLRPSS